MRAPAAALIALVVAVAAVGCGSAKDTRRRHVNAYIVKVNELEVQAAAEWRRVQTSYSSVGDGHLTPAKLQALTKARTTILSLRRRVAGLSVPQDARRLRASLLRLMDADAEVAAELAEFGRYVTAIAPLEQRVAADTKALQRGLQKTKARSGEERILGEYVTRLGDVIHLESRLKAPRALEPWDAEQDRRLQHLRGGAAELEEGLAQSDEARATGGLNELRSAVTQQSVTPADREAIIAYNARVMRVRKLAAAVGRAQNRLTREFT